MLVNDVKLLENVPIVAQAEMDLRISMYTAGPDPDPPPLPDPVPEAVPEEVPAMQEVDVTVPDGLGPGMEMSIEWGGQLHNIIVPDGVGAGMLLRVQLPA